METKVFQSSNLLKGQYDSDTKIMSLWFGNGTRYDYPDISPQLWADLTTATSPGSFFYSKIRPHYAGTRANNS